MWRDEAEMGIVIHEDLRLKYEHEHYLCPFPSGSAEKGNSGAVHMERASPP